MRSRFYRFSFEDPGWFRVSLFETDVYCTSDPPMEDELRRAIFSERLRVERFAKDHPELLFFLVPLDLDDPFVPNVVSLMLSSSRKAGVGPMAAVAGAIVEAAGLTFLDRCSRLIMENGGDLFFYDARGGRIGIYAGESPFSGRIALRIPEGERVWGVSTSSGSLGHSLSFGCADAVTVVSGSPSLSDAFATSICNRIKSPDDVDRIMEEAESGGYPELDSVVIVFGDKLAIWGHLEVECV